MFDSIADDANGIEAVGGVEGGQAGILVEKGKGGLLDLVDFSTSNHFFRGAGGVFAFIFDFDEN